jgi:hypothetical protein
MEAPARDGPPRWARLRAYGVPATMIAEATAAREAGDWRGACAAAGVDVAVDLVGVRREHGRRAADAVADDLTHFAPDLLRWHQPRVPDLMSLNPWTSVVLRPARRDAPFLILSPPNSLRGPQRLTLWTTRRRALKHTSYFDAPRHLWDARHAGELRHAWGGSDHRPPLLKADGSPVPTDRLGAGGDRAGHTERVLAMMAAGQHAQAWREAGIDLDASEPSDPDRPFRRLEAHGVWPVGLAEEARRLADLYRVRTFNVGHPYAPVMVSVAPDGSVMARLTDQTPRRNQPYIAEPVYRVPPDLWLLRHGRITPEDLHPLVRASLFPRMGPPPRSQPRILDEPPMVRVRCRGEWHWVGVVGGRITALGHDDDEERREAVVRALGGTSSGCHAALAAWTEGRGRLPKLLRYQRQELFERMYHGDTGFVLAMLDSGRLDARMRGWEGLTLLHMLVYLDHEPLLSRVLDAGVPVDARDQYGRTPLYVAVVHGGSAGLVRDLRRAGADLDAADDRGLTVRDRILRKAKRSDVG